MLFEFPANAQGTKVPRSVRIVERDGEHWLEAGKEQKKAVIDKAAFITFSQLPAKTSRESVDAVKDFALRYGMLSGEAIESVDAWVKQIRDMRTALEVWRAITEKDYTWLQEHIGLEKVIEDKDDFNIKHDWQDAFRVYENYIFKYKTNEFLKKEVIAGTLMNARRKGQLKQLAGLNKLGYQYPIHKYAAQTLVVKLINRNIGNFSGDVAVQQSKKDFRLVYKPRNLQAMLWLQFASKVSQAGKEDMVQCQQCADWYTRKRSTSRYCSTRCRMASHRQANSAAVQP